MQEKNCVKLKDLLTASIQRNLSNAILLSGGVDSSIIASIAVKITGLTGITTVNKNAPDLLYAKIVSEKYQFKHLINHLTIEDMNDAIENVVKIIKSFDPMEIRNTSVIYSSLKELKSNGFSSVMTGDGADEIFVGYNYMLKLDDETLESVLKELWHKMHFSSITIGKALGVTVRTPYLDRELLEFSRHIPIGLKIGDNESVKFGKWILRTCFEDDITRDIAWRRKMSLEEGAGLDVFATSLNININDTTYSESVKSVVSEDSVRIRSREHLYYYMIYRRFFDAPKTMKGDNRCPDCKGCVSKDSKFCDTCGAFPIMPSRTNAVF